MAFSVLRRATLCAGLALVLLFPRAADAGELLQNGGFEQGTSGWNGSGLSTSECSPRSGSGALSVPNFAQQTLPTPVGSGTYTLDGWTRAAGASTSMEVNFIWYDVNGSQLAVSTENHTAGADYSHFSFSATRPASAHGLRLRITASGGAVCLDDLSLDGPPMAPPATATATPAQQPTAPAGTTPASGTPRPSATPRPTSTPRPSATPARPSAADAAPPPSYSITNGGFEDGLAGWSKFGGTLELAHSPVQSGAQAGRLVSRTNSTKWAYQVVLVDPSRTYEFAGYLAAEAGVSSALLRISWYASSDGSGQQLSTTDSTESLTADSGYVYLTTGPVGPPPDAHSARARVVMTPIGAAAASIAFDDLWFGEAAPATAEPQPPPEADLPSDSTDNTDVNVVNVAALARTAPQIAASPNRPTAEVRAAIVSAPTVVPLPSGPLPRQEESGGVPLIWLAAAAGAAIIAGAGYWQGKRRGL